jgi:hypothetical protein
MSWLDTPSGLVERPAPPTALPVVAPMNGSAVSVPELRHEVRAIERPEVEERITEAERLAELEWLLEDDFDTFREVRVEYYWMNWRVMGRVDLLAVPKAPIRVCEWNEPAPDLAGVALAFDVKPFVPEPEYRRYDPTAGMTMPRSALEEMLRAEPRGFMQGVVRDNRAPTSPSTMPRSEQPSNVHPGGASATPGYVDPRPLSNPPGTNWVDAIAIADEVRQRKEKK